LVFVWLTVSGVVYGIKEDDGYKVALSLTSVTLGLSLLVVKQALHKEREEFDKTLTSLMCSLRDVNAQYRSEIVPQKKPDKGNE